MLMRWRRPDRCRIVAYAGSKQSCAARDIELCSDEMLPEPPKRWHEILIGLAVLLNTIVDRQIAL
jgi:hypothetical protein